MYSTYNKNTHHRHGGHGGRVQIGQSYTKAPHVTTSSPTQGPYHKLNLYDAPPRGLGAKREQANPMEVGETKAYDKRKGGY